MKRFFFPFLINFFFASSAFAQKEANIWYFGYDAGLDFNSGTPVPLANGAIKAMEGCAVISDANGKLLFYTNGENVWTKAHSLMENGTSLKGFVSSSQSSLIVPAPCDSSKYYIFTADGNSQDEIGRCCYPFDSAFAYSIVDMTFNGGLGKVVQKNTVLFSGVNEKVAGVKHYNRRDSWVLSYNVEAKKIYAYLVTVAGIRGPVISSIVHLPSFSGNYLRISPKGNRIALSGHSSNLVLYDFDNRSGIISNPVTLSNIRTYGIEFSPDGNVLYSEDFNVLPTKLVQFNLSAATPAQINASKVIIAYDYMDHFKALQLGPDGKIYIANSRSNYLSCIANPNLLGTACNFVENAVELGGKESGAGLPNFIQSFLNPGYIPYESCCPFVELKNTEICAGDSVILDAYFSEASYLWSDGTTGSTLKVFLPGKYWVNVSVNNCNRKFSTEIKYKDCIAFVPNLITPNGDFLNDVFEIKGLVTDSWKIEIYSRWGDLIFINEDYDNNWKTEIEGVYFYSLKNKISGQTFKGWIQVIR